jgi:hypothetical protein
VATDPTLGPWQETTDIDVVQTGAWILLDERPLPADLVAFLDAGTPPVYVGFGSNFDEGVIFRDPDGEFVGHDGIEAFSDSLQRRFPGARFRFADTPQMLGNAIRGIWQFGPPENPGAISDMDFAIWDGCRVTALYAFVKNPQ